MPVNGFNNIYPPFPNQFPLSNNAQLQNLALSFQGSLMSNGGQFSFRKRNGPSFRGGYFYNRGFQPNFFFMLNNPNFLNNAQLQNAPSQQVQKLNEDQQNVSSEETKETDTSPVTDQQETDQVDTEEPVDETQPVDGEDDTQDVPAGDTTEQPDPDNMETQTDQPVPETSGTTDAADVQQAKPENEQQADVQKPQPDQTQQQQIAQLYAMLQFLCRPYHGGRHHRYDRPWRHNRC